MATRLIDPPTDADLDADADTGADARRHDRHIMGMKGSARIALGIDIIDASTSGVRACLSVPVPVGTLIKIGLAGQTRHARVVWTSGDETGCEWLAPLAPHELKAVLGQAKPAAA